MRVRTQLDLAFSGSDACVGIDAGTTRDYIVNLTPAPPWPAPTALSVTDNTSSSAKVSWTENGTATSWEIEWGLKGFAHGSGNTIPASSKPYTLGGLSVNTEYDFYVRADCGGGNYSDWTGPKSFTTTQTPATLPYNDNLNSNDYTLVNGSEVNQWVYGPAAGNPANSIFISNDYGTNNFYDPTKNSVVYAYRDITIPSGTTIVNLGFDWRGQGEGSSDYLRVWLVPVSFEITTGVEITNVGGRIQVEGNFNQQNSWQTYQKSDLDLSSFAGQTMRLVFEWRNDGSAGTNPAAAIDNVLLSNDEMDWCNLQHPGTGTITEGGDLLVYTRGYESGVTDASSSAPGPGISVWIGTSSTDTDPSGSGWT